MRLDTGLPENHNGWLMPGQNAMYGNTPMIQYKLIKSVMYYRYADKFNSTGDKIKTSKAWYIDFDDNVWYYDDKDKMLQDYTEIAILITGARKNKRKII